MSEPKTHEYTVKMTCEGCSGAIQRVLGKLEGKGVDKIEIDLKGQKVKVVSTLSAEEILEVIKKTGKEAAHVSTT